MTRDSETNELLVVDDDGLWRRPTTDSEELLGHGIERLTAALDAKDDEIHAWKCLDEERVAALEESRALLERALVVTHAHYVKREGAVVQPLRDDIKAFLGD